jgi:hypothetical protein
LIRNLVDNAVNYTPSSAQQPGVVTARVLADPFGRVLVLQVEDTGPGIPEGERELVFQPFYRSLDTNVDGSGLGLPIVLEIARQHEAEIRIEDARPGHVPPGTRVTVRFDATRAAPVETPAAPPQAACTGSAAAARARSRAPPPAAAPPSARAPTAREAGRVDLREAAPAQQRQRIGIQRPELLAAQEGCPLLAAACAIASMSPASAGIDLGVERLQLGLHLRLVANLNGMNTCVKVGCTVLFIQASVSSTLVRASGSLRQELLLGNLASR